MLREIMANEFEIKDHRALKDFLSMKIARSSKNIFAPQQSKLLIILENSMIG